MAAVIAAGVFCRLYSGGHVASSPVTRAKVNMRSGHVIVDLQREREQRYDLRGGREGSRVTIFFLSATSSHSQSSQSGFVSSQALC